MQVVAIDPGSRITGWAWVAWDVHQWEWQADIWRLGSGDITGRLANLLKNVEECLNHFRPDLLVLEQIFVHRDPRASFTLGQVQGVVLAACGRFSVPVRLMTPAQARKMVLQSGSLNKAQVQKPWSAFYLKVIF